MLRLAAGGVVVGLGLAAMLGRLMGSLLYGTGGIDPLSFAAAPAFLVLVALEAGLAGARRATRIDPLTVLRGRVTDCGDGGRRNT